MVKQTTARLVAALFIIWVFFVLATFYAVQKPFSTETALTVTRTLLDILTALWLALVALGLGNWLLARLLPAPDSLLETLVLATPLGLGMLGLLSLLQGLVGWFNPLTAYLVTLLLTIVAAPQLWRLFKQVAHRRPDPQTLPGRWTAIYLALTVAFALPVALLPPTDWDGLFYHLTGPKLYLQAGQIFGGFDVPHFNFPSLMELLFAWAMLLRGDVAAKLLHNLFALLLAGLVYLITRRFLGQKAAWPSLLVLASMPMLGVLAGWAYNDLALAFFQLAAIYAIINYQLAIINEQLKMATKDEGRKTDVLHSSSVLRRPSGNYLILSGLFAGLAMGLKYTSFVTPLVIVLFITFYVLRFTHFNIVALIKALAAFALPAMLVALPWYLKSWWFTGNPVYPFLYGLFGGVNWDEFRAAWYASAGTGIGGRVDTLLGLPWLLTLGVKDMNFWDGRTGPLLLMFLPFVVWAGVSRRFAGKEVPPAAKLLLVFALAHYLFWTLGVVWSHSLFQSRLLLPGLVALVPVSAWVWVNLSGFDLPCFSLSRFVNIAVALALALTLVDTALITLRIDPLPYLLGLESRDDNLTRRLGAHYLAMQKINTDLPEEATVLLLWEPRSYYCARDCRPDSILDEFPHAVQQYATAEAIARAWRDEGITHILLHRAGLEYMLNEQSETINRTVLAELEANYWEKLADVAGAYELYRIKVP